MMLNMQHIYMIVYFWVSLRLHRRVADVLKYKHIHWIALNVRLKVCIYWVNNITDDLRKEMTPAADRDVTEEIAEQLQQVGVDGEGLS